MGGMMTTSLEYYKVFYYAVKSGSISGAAKELCISQPAASQAVKQLENALGGSLFVRTSKGLKLTKEGEVLYSYIEKGYESILLGEEKFKNLLDLDAGEIIIGASDMTLQFYLLPYLEKYHEEYPNIKIRVTNAPTPETLRNLNDGKIDFGIVTTPFSREKDLERIDVKKVRTIFVGGSEYQEYKGKVIALSELNNMPLICLEKNTSTRKAADSFFEENKLKQEPDFELATSDMIVQFAIRNLGIGMVAEDFAKEHIKNGSLFELELEKKMEERTISIVISEKNHISNAGRKLLDMLITETKKCK